MMCVNENHLNNFIDMVLSFLLFSGLFHFSFTSPCTNHAILDTPEDFTRSVANTAGQKCDNTLNGNWYRVVSKSGEKMPTECVYGGFRCGTQYSIWLNGTYPNTGQTKNITACAASHDGDCCKYSYEISVMNCTSFLVYHLANVNTCPQAYCFGTELPCAKTHVSPNGFSPGCKYEPCLPINYNNLDQWERSIGNINGHTMCDNTLRSGWYRPVSLAGNTMPTVCPSNGYKCGTVYPIWMNGTHPTTANITANVTACMSNYDGNCCSLKFDIQVRRCSDFFIYYLTSTKGCYQSYCFGTEIPCAVGYTSVNGFTPGCSFDPCHSINYNWLTNEPKRTSNYTLKMGESPIDDRDLESGWYRVDSVTGNDIVNETVKQYQCGTIFPVWMKGSIPSAKNKTETRTVCKVGPGENSCQEEFSISVRNCGQFRTYKLARVNWTSSAYCFGTLPFQENANGEEPEVKFYIYIIVALGIVVIILIGILIWKRENICARNGATRSTSTVGILNSPPPPTYEETIFSQKLDKR